MTGAQEYDQEPIPVMKKIEFGPELWSWYPEKEQFATKEDELRFMAELREQKRLINEAHRIRAQRAQQKKDAADRRRAQIYAEVFRATLEEFIMDLVKSGVLNVK